MSRHRNHRHELFAQALAMGKSRAEAMIAAGYTPHRGNQNRLAQLADIVARVEEIRRYNEQIVDLRKIDRSSRNDLRHHRHEAQVSVAGDSARSRS